MEKFLQSVNQLLWGFPVLILILTVGILLTSATGFAQIRLFPQMCKEFLRSIRHKEQGISGYRALCTALAATVGTGNIVGVAGAIAIGGPGVVFWMWVCAILGMVTKFAEVTIAMIYREKDMHGNWLGGPMYIIKNALPKRYHYLASIYAFFGIVAAFGIGNATQVNAVIGGLQMIADASGRALNSVQVLIAAVLMAVIIIMIIRTGANGIGCWAERLVPPAALVYILLALLAIFQHANKIPEVLRQITLGAFTPQSATCGTISSVLMTLRVGASRGVFTNEAGMGTASIAHSSATATSPVSQGLLGSMDVFLDTIVMCTLTAFAILCSGIAIPYGSDPGIQLTLQAFTISLGNWSSYLIIILICIFAFATVLGWSLYGMRCMQYLFDTNTDKIYMFFQFLAVIAGCIANTNTVWIFSEIVNGLMSIPNLIALLLLLPVFQSQIYEYENKAYSR